MSIANDPTRGDWCGVGGWDEPGTAEERAYLERLSGKRWPPVEPVADVAGLWRDTGGES